MTVARALRTASALTATALAAGGLVALAPPATAAPPAPGSVMFVDRTTQTLKVGAADGSGATTVATPAGVDVRYATASADGSVVALWARAGQHRASGYPLAAYGLWVSAGGSTRNVTAYTDAPPAVTADGSWVVWSAYPSGGVANVYGYDVANHKVVLLCGCLNTSVGSGAGEVVSIDAQSDAPSRTIKLAASSARYDNAGLLVGTRVQVLTIHYDARLGTPTTQLDKSTVVPQSSFPGLNVALSQNGDTVATIAANRTTNPANPWTGGGTVWTADLTAPTPALAATTLTGYFAARQGGSPLQWYLFADSGTSVLTSLSDALVGAPGTPVSRPDGATTDWYRPVTGTPAAVSAPGALPVVGYGVPRSASLLRYGARLGLDPYVYYSPTAAVTFGNGAAVTPTSVYDDLGDYMTDGYLQVSPNGASAWRTVSTARSTVAGKGYPRTLVPVRTQFYRWVSYGSANVQAKVLPAFRVTVTSVVSIAKSRRSGRTAIYGKVTRPSGTVVLQRLRGRTWVKVATARLSSRGVYTFGYRSLVRGSYRVVSVADTYQASGISARVAV